MQSTETLQPKPLVIHPLKPGPNVFYGHAVLDQLGLDLPLVDLLVRETIQNALDACSGTGPVTVEFKTRTMESSRVLSLLQHGNEMMIKEPMAPVLEISDHGTIGLDGPGSLSETLDPAGFGRFIRLVFSMGVNQQALGAGGSHGVGKSIYYHLGKGLAFYHSRAESPIGDERLVACWVEDQQEGRGFLKSMTSSAVTTGVCWWGGESVSGHATPMTDPCGLEMATDALGIHRRTDPASNGTTVLVPFLDLDRLECRHLNELADKISIAVLKWYFPRMDNPDWVDGPALIVKVNGVPLEGQTAQNLMPGFRKWQEVWKAARTGESSNSIDLRKIETSGLDGPLGFLAWTHDLHAGLDGEQIFAEDAPQSIALVRKPGMVIRYHQADAWLPSQPGGKQLMAVFVVQSQASIVARQLPRKLSVEEYFRACEAGNHHGWIHRHEVGNLHLGERSNFVQRLRLAIRKHLDPLIRLDVQESNKDHELGKFLGQWLIPKGFNEGRLFAFDTELKTIKIDAITKPALELVRMRQDKGLLSIDAKLELPAEGSWRIEPKADLGTSWMGLDDWKSLNNGNEPFTPMSLSVDNWRIWKQPGAPWKKCVQEGTTTSLVDVGGNLHAVFRPDGQGKSWVVDTIKSSKVGLLIDIVVCIKASDPSMRLGLQLVGISGGDA